MDIYSLPMLCVYSTDSPLVKIIKEVTEKKLKLICNPKGNPENYTFADWEHWSEFNEHIRNVQGTPDGTLTFLESNNNNRLHENDGIYKCRTSNGIYDTNGDLYQNGTALIIDRVPPVFVNANKPIQFGRYGQRMNLTVFLYNKYGTIQTTISKQNETLHTHGRQETIQTHDIFHDVNVTVSGIKITYLLTVDTIEDFTDYTIKACNGNGCNELTVKIQLTYRLEPPTNVSVVFLEGNLKVSWYPGYNGGLPQKCFLEYQSEYEELWRRSGPVIDKKEKGMSKILYDIIPNTRYHVRVLAINEIGESNTTKVITLEDQEMWSRSRPIIDNMELRMSKILYNIIPNTRFNVRVLSKNEIGESNTTTVITLDCPEPPTNVSVISFESHLVVSWCPGYNGGFPQTFFVEYKSEDQEMWKRSGPVIDNMEIRMSKIVYVITPNTRYHVRVLSKNEIGEINTTTVITSANYTSVKQALSSQGIFILVLVIIITVLGPGIGLCIRKIITPTNVPTTEDGSDERAHYTEINEDDYRRTTLQENDNPIISMVNIIGVENTDTASQSSEHPSASSDSNTNSSENYDDGIITPTNITTTESSAHYTEINRDYYRRTTLQENDNSIISTVNVMGVENTDTAVQSSEYSSESSNINIDISENYDDGYEKPYTTLVVQHRADDEHIYLTTNKFAIYENSTPVKAACGRSFEFRKQDTSQIETNPYVYENDDEENANLSYIENDFDKKDNAFHRSHIDPPKNKAEYINLMLK
ncbi:unnamed protein product [Mytilus coruscus]|uniref:Fibronectin type-III domain-containing protein n=1 Tax=Mytilus coruscus TaxID=42192 RepID=A0A6J8ARC0_MYTCO|nr:unnamed protein product [Mytilus coruscus]